MADENMKLSYYTIDDLRLGCDPEGERGWRQSRFLDWRDALEQYRSLPDSAVKVFGLCDGAQDVELVRRLPTGPGSAVWENILVLDFPALPLWKEEGVVTSLKELTVQLDIRYCLTEEKLVPAPIGPVSLRRCWKDKYLWPDVPNVLESAIRWLYLADVGWVPPRELRRRFPAPGQRFHYPVVLKYRVDGMTENGCYAPLELSHWEYLMLARRTQERLDHKKHEGGEHQ